jgi:hypothetical protein
MVLAPRRHTPASSLDCAGDGCRLISAWHDNSSCDFVSDAFALWADQDGDDAYEIKHQPSFSRSTLRMIDALQPIGPPSFSLATPRVPRDRGNEVWQPIAHHEID